MKSNVDTNLWEFLLLRCNTVSYYTWEVRYGFKVENMSASELQFTSEFNSHHCTTVLLPPLDEYWRGNREVVSLSSLGRDFHVWQKVASNCYTLLQWIQGYARFVYYSTCIFYCPIQQHGPVRMVWRKQRFYNGVITLFAIMLAIMKFLHTLMWVKTGFFQWNPIIDSLLI